jgi:4-amino-4-deoxy-L-arabinose transferase-like glycosyltransferase
MTEPAGRWERESAVHAALMLILLTATLLRFWSLTARLPYGIGTDEPQIVDRAIAMLQTGNLHPHFFDYPGLYIYLQFGVAVLRFLAGASAGQYASLSSFGADDLYPWARACSAALGTLTVAVTFLAARRFGAWEAIAAAALLAVLPGHVRESHFALTDTPLTLFVALTWLTTLRAHEAPSARTFAMAGAMVGLAAATKYNGAIAMLLPLVAVWMTPATTRFRLLASAAAICAAAAAYLIAAPYTVLDLPAFLDRFAKLNVEYFQTRSEIPPWEAYAKHLLNSFKWPAFVFGGAGIILALSRWITGPRRILWALPLLIIAPGFWLIASRTLVYGRYLLPVMPPTCALAGVSFVWSARLIAVRLRRPAALVIITVVAVIALGLPLATAIAYDRWLGRPNTAAETYSWLRRNVPLNSALAIEDGALRMPSGMYSVTDVKHLTERPLEAYRSANVRYLITVSTQFAIRNGERVKTSYALYFVQMRQLFSTVPSKDIDGPEIRVYELAP